MTPARILPLFIIAASAVTADAGDTYGPTCGLVTGLRGRAFLVEPQTGTVTELKSPGAGVPCGVEILTAEGAAARITDLKGNRIILGSATHATFVSNIQVDVSTGAVAVDQRSPSTVRLTSAVLEGESTAVAALWTGGEDAQWLSLSGDSQVWHPELPNAPVRVRASLYTETTRSTEYLDPRSAREPDVAVAKRFIASFGEAALQFVAMPTTVAQRREAKPVAVAVQRHPAAVEAKHIAAVVEPIAAAPRKSRGIDPWTAKDFLARLQARIQGEDYDEDAALASKRQVKVDPATQRRIAEGAKRKAQVARREDALRQALGKGPDAVTGNRAIASSAPAPKVEAVPYPDELEKENVSLINKLIHTGGKARRP